MLMFQKQILSTTSLTSNHGCFLTCTNCIITLTITSSDSQETLYRSCGKCITRNGMNRNGNRQHVASSFSRYWINKSQEFCDHIVFHPCMYVELSWESSKPTLNRLDFDKLTLHASQYRVRCGISETSQKWWIDHLQHLKAICSGDSQAEPTPTWPLNVLREAAQRQNHVLPADNTGGVLMILIV